MKAGLLLLLILWPGSSPSIAELALEAYQAKEYRKAGRLYQAVSEKWPELKSAATYNEAIAWMQADSAQLAQPLYAQLARAGNPEIRSRALNNRAVFLANENKVGEAMELLKQALREFPGNDLARYNYEVLRKPQPNPPPPPPDPEQENQQQKQNKNQPSKPKPTEQNGNRSDNPAVSDAEAERILKELGAKEQQFLQQLRKKVKNKAERDGRPSW